MRNTAIFAAAALCGLVCFPGAVSAQAKGLEIEIQSPSSGFVVSSDEREVEIEGVASTIGGVRYLDMIFVMDTSSSLKGNDKQDYRSQGAVGLVQNLSPRSDIKMGVVSFSGKGKVELEMTSDRGKVIDSLRSLERSGSTKLGAGIMTALEELERNGRPGSSKVIMLFTDGQSNRYAAHQAAIKAHAKGVTVQTLLLGSNRTGSEILDEIAWATGGQLVRVEDPSKLPEAFLNLRTTGVDTVSLSVNGSEPVAAKLAGGTFLGNVTLDEGENRIVAFATSIDGRTKESEIMITVQDASCAALGVQATKDGRPVVSLNDRSIEIVVDASRSMWGRMNGEPKMSVAKNILNDVSYWFPEDLDLALRAYGSRSPSDSNDCSDSTLLVPFADQNREPIRQAIAGLRPLGQTPIAYALRQASQDFGARDADRAVVLVTDGLESCGGDPVWAARELRDQGIKVHVIGFGMGNAKDEDTASLAAIADASGGSFVTAGSAEELQFALAQTVATSFSVFKGATEVASSALGSNDTIYLPEGDYRVVLHSSPPQEAEVRLSARDSVTVMLEKQGGYISQAEQRGSIEYRSCEDAVAKIERLEARQQQSLQSANQ